MAADRACAPHFTLFKTIFDIPPVPTAA